MPSALSFFRVQRGGLLDVDGFVCETLSYTVAGNGTRDGNLVWKCYQREGTEALHLGFDRMPKSLVASGRRYTFSSGERYLQQWHGTSLEDTTSNLAALTTLSNMPLLYK
jgi:hypothetical protein